jgi:hypothetical protein
MIVAATGQGICVILGQTKGWRASLLALPIHIDQATGARQVSNIVIIVTF